MDGESNYESDISDSWSLIDINLNEEAVEVSGVCEELEKPSSGLKNIKSNDTDAIELDELSNFNKENKVGLSGSSDLKSQFCDENQVSVSPSKEESGVESILEEEEKNDSGDNESIEILEVDGIERDTDTDIERLDISVIDQEYINDGAYHSQDEESADGRNISDAFKSSSSSTVIRKRKRKASRHSESSRDGVNFDYTAPSEKHLSMHVSETQQRDDQSLESISHPVYKHYRNNVANTVLSLSVSVVFAGVVCIAIGHFLGVQDAAETVVELMEEIRKLQMESIALQSRLLHINKAFVSQETDSKLELRPKKLQNKISCVQSPKLESANFEKKVLKSAANSVDLASKLPRFVSSKSQELSKGTDYDRAIDFDGIGKYIHDQLNFIDNKIREGAKLKHLEDSDKRISRELSGIMDRLSATQGSIKNLYQRVMKLRDKFKNKVSVLPDPVEKRGEVNFQKSVPIRERDLNSLQWNPGKKLYLPEILKAVPLYKYPQVQEYYKSDNNSRSIIERESARIDTSEVESSIKSVSETEKHFLKYDPSEKGQQRIKKDKKDSEKKKGKKREDKKKYISKEKERKGRKRDKKRKPLVDKNRKTKEEALVSEPLKYNGKMQTLNETIHQKKKQPHMDDFKRKRKAFAKKSKKSKIFRVFLDHSNKIPSRDNNNDNNSNDGDHKYSLLCSDTNTLPRDPRCLNLTGQWIFKRADGREEFRHHQTLSSWQFERAKKRKELRDENTDENWQFKRASARERNRNEEEDCKKDKGVYNGKDIFQRFFGKICSGFE